MNNKLRIVFYVLLLTSFVLLFSCSNSTEPEPGSREYTWEVDTIKIGENDGLFLTNIWGSIPRDIWAVGSSNDYRYHLWHYNSIEWKYYEENKEYLSAHALIGLNRNNIWLGALRGEMWHYDGSSWGLHSSYLPDDGTHALLENFIKTGENEIYGCGASSVNGEWLGIIVKYDGNKWDLLDVPKVNYTFASMAKLDNNGTFLICGYSTAVSSNKEQLYLLKNGKITILEEGGYNYELRIIDNRTYFLDGQKIYRYENEELKLWKDFSNTNFIGRLWGRNENDLFTFNENGIGHYNGRELKTIYNFENCYINNAAIFEKDVFFILRTKGTNHHRIIHGTLE